MEVSVIFFWVIYALIVISFLKSIITDLIKEKNKTGVALYISILLSVGYTFQYIHNYDIFSASWGIGIFVTIIVLSIVFNLLCILSKRILISRHIRKMQKKLKQTSVSDFIYYLMEKHNKYPVYVLHIPSNNTIEIGYNIMNENLVIGKGIHFRTLSNRSLYFTLTQPPLIATIKDDVFCTLHDYYNHNNETKSTIDNYISKIQDNHNTPWILNNESVQK
ncbi:hypothetical protein ACQNJN_003039 [Escherichia coli]|uniref:hypothetical protein n=1 Tax=Escherichia coli TaxID=562 RepID=UPI00053AAADD|nr:hypothetical protein [Escherichia coli]EFW8114705.1 hypothetical protein [Shigella sonnei]EIG6217812.1 hypothetical protein [Shigella dysenteriae]EIH4990868.1 hypothetical protein [Shigella boydii]ODQ12489.1 hypothetical protein BGK51_20655 [Shigella sp. FC569]HDL6812763.1 hypothetical protein [Escherichia coli 371_08]HDL6832043.1 hypothetical protein [Escherichia coli 229_11]HDL7560493.1 hypothetical protein [Escherichia coli 151_06]